MAPETLHLLVGARRHRILMGTWVGWGVLAFALTASAQTPGTLRWKLTPEAPGNWSGSSVGPDGTVYVSLCETNGKGVVYALDGALGTIKWQFHSTCFSSTPAVGENGSVYVGGGDQQVHALSAADGSVLWTYSAAGFGFEASPAIGADGTVYIGCDDKNLYALDGTTGAKRWSFLTGGQIHEAPAVGVNGTIYTGSSDGNLYALDSVTGLKKWVFSTGGPIVCSPAIGGDGAVYFGSGDQKVYAVNVVNGAEQWEYPTSAAVDWSPLLADDMVVIGSKDGQMYSLDMDTGQTCWSLDLGAPYSRLHPIYGTDGNLYFGGPGWFVALDHITKETSWYVTTPNTNNLSCNVAADGTVYFGSDRGPFYAYWSGSLGGLGESPWPAYGQNVRHTGLAPSGPKILNQPGSKAIQLGGAATLSAVVIGRPPLSFQWMLNAKPVTGATNTVLVLTNLQPPKLGDYTIVITNSFGSVTSAPATLGLNILPAITLQPQDEVVPLGGLAKFSVAATNGSPLLYQWQLNLTNLAGATQPDLLLTNVGLINAGVYRALVSSGAGTVASSNATLIVVSPAALHISTDGQVSLTGTAGGTYRVESTHDLGNASWLLLTNVVVSSNSVWVSTGALANSSTIFYRAITAQ